MVWSVVGGRECVRRCFCDRVRGPVCSFVSLTISVDMDWSVPWEFVPLVAGAIDLGPWLFPWRSLLDRFLGLCRPRSGLFPI